MKRKRYRYIWCGKATIEDLLEGYRLVSYGDNFSCIRIELPDDVKLDYYRGDGYTTVTRGCELRIKDCNPHAMIRKNGRLVIEDSLLNYPIHMWHRIVDFD